MTAEYTINGNVALIKLAKPPVNTLGYSTRLAMSEAVAKANQDPSIAAIVLTGAGKAFSAGADISEFDSTDSMKEPNLLTLILELEASSKPVVAAVHSVCIGGGFEIALGCHYRVFAPGTSVGLPEVKLGLLPGAGGTQRLPRVLGVENALNLIVSGDLVKSEELAKLPGQQLIDKLSASPESLLDEAMEFARWIAGKPRIDLPLVRLLPCTHPQGDAYFQFAKNTIGASSKNYPAPLQCVEAVRDATKLRFDDGMAAELARFAVLKATPQSMALRHVFMAERAATKVEGVPNDVKQRSVRSVGVIGAGTMGTGIAINFLNAGVPVKILETKQDALDRGVATIRSLYESQLKKGKLKQENLAERIGLLSTTLSYDEFADCDLVIEAVFEDMSVKQKVFEELDRVAKPGAILASNTSTLDVDKIAAFTKRPQDVVGMHFFSPANVMKLLEVVRGEKTATDVLSTVMLMARKIKKTAVVSGVCDGFIGNRMIEQYLRQAGFLLDEGATPQQVDKAIERFGFAMGPFRMGDLAGNDIGWAIRKRRAVERADMKYSRTADKLCELGRYGQKAGAGWYDYQAGKRDPVPSKVVLDMIDQHRKDLGIAPRKIADDEIVERLVYALVNEGAHILEEGVASRSSDIDLVYLTGYGFPAWRGGPMHYAGQVGLFNVVAAMKRFAMNPLDDAAFWQPAPLIQKLVASGKQFS